MLVFGTRPEAIKICPLVKKFRKHNEEFESKRPLLRLWLLRDSRHLCRKKIKVKMETINQTTVAPKTDSVDNAAALYKPQYARLSCK